MCIHNQAAPAMLQKLIYTVHSQWWLGTGSQQAALIHHGAPWYATTQTSDPHPASFIMLATASNLLK